MDTLLMAQQLQTLSIEATGFLGINTQDSPTNIDTSFAAKADNCVIDEFGRIGARKGTRQISDVDATTAALPLVSLFEFIDPNGNDTFLTSHNKKIYSYVLGETSAINKTPAGYTVTDDNWKIVSLQDHAFFFNRDQEPLIWHKESGTYGLEAFSDHAHATGNVPYANEALAAYGRVWVADVTNDKSTVYWSDLLNGHAWSGGTSGSLNLQTVWTSGFDEIVALAAHNGFLVIFGRHSIVIYSGAESPANMVLEDVIEGIGCIERDSVQNTGSDIIFLSNDGVRSLGRTIQEKSSPIGDISRNIRNSLMATVKRHSGPIKSTYAPKEGFYLLSMPEENITYCFDLKKLLPEGAARVTTWSQINPHCFCLDHSGNLYIGALGGLLAYDTFTDTNNLSATTTYLLEYESNPMDFGRPANLKFLRKFETSVIGNVGENSTLTWYYDYSPSTLNTFNFAPPALEPNSEEFSNIENNRIANGYFENNITNWTVNNLVVHGSGGGISTTINPETLVVRGDSSYAYQNISTQVTTGKTYTLIYDVVEIQGLALPNPDASGAVIKVGNAANDGTVYNSGKITETGSYFHTFTATDDADFITLGAGGTSADKVWYDNIQLYQHDTLNSTITTGYTGAEFSADVNQTGYTGSEFTSGLLVQTPSAHGSGNGKVVTIGLKATIDGSAYSIQRIDIQVLLGRTV